MSAPGLLYTVCGRSEKAGTDSSYLIALQLQPPRIVSGPFGNDIRRDCVEYSLVGFSDLW